MKFRIEKPSPAMIVAIIALMVSLGTGAYAANSIFSTDIVDGEVKTADLANFAITNVKLANNSINSIKIANNTITSLDIKGADTSGNISLTAGFAGIGLCRDFNISASGAAVGEAVVVSLRGPLIQGILMTGVRVSAVGTVVMKACNFTGAAAPAITNLPIRVMTFG